MEDMLQDKLMAFFRAAPTFKVGDRLLLACSGGPDSVALAHLIVRCNKKLGFQLALAHVNHGLRASPC